MSSMISSSEVYAALRARVDRAVNTLDERRESALEVVREHRIPGFTLPMLAGRLTSNYAVDTVVALRVAGETRNPEVVCQLVLSIAAALFDPQTVREAPQKLTVPTGRAGFAETAAFKAAPSTTLNFDINGTPVNVASYFLKAGSEPLATDADARAMLTMAIYAAGKAITDQNAAGFFGDKDTGGRAKAIKAVTGADDAYITGNRSLKQPALKNINVAFASNPGARYALFSMLNLIIVRGANPVEQAVAGQANLLTSEGRGSFERALMAFDTYGEILFLLPNYRREIEGLARATERLSRQPMLMQNYGYLIDRDSYRTLRVSQFATLAALGGLIVGSEHIQNSLSDAAMLAVNGLYLKLAELSVARENLAKAEADRQTAAAKAAAGSA